MFLLIFYLFNFVVSLSYGQLVQTLFSSTWVATSDGFPMDSKVTHTIDVLNKVECASYALYHQSHGFRMKDSDTICELMDLEKTMYQDGGEKVFIDSSIPPGDVSWGPWSAWPATCSEPCDSGTQTRSRTCQTPTFRGVVDCSGSSVDSQACNTDPCPRINKVVWRTNGESYADMADYNNNDEGIVIAVVSSYGETCWSTPLNNPETNWRKNTEDTFDSDDAADLDECWNFRVPNRDIKLVRVEHQGKDSWKGEWVDIYFTVGNKVRCQTLDGKRWYIFRKGWVDVFCS